MKKSLVLALSLSVITLAVAVSTSGQEKQLPPDRVTIERGISIEAPPGLPVPPSQGLESQARTFSWIESEFTFDGKLVKNSPYSAQAVTETTQTLSDGNRIINKTSSTLYRDSEGRTRREQSLKALGNFAAGEVFQTVVINDPVAGVTYSLDPNTHTARKSGIFRLERTRGPLGEAAPQAGTVKSAPNAGFVITGPATVKGGSPGVFTFKLEDDSKNVLNESLGTQSIEGVDAEGTRITFTIPAGSMGNERPITIVDEHWYSPALQAVVMTRHSDPRMGESVYRLTNIDRSEPAHSLFEVPGDYQIIDQPFNVAPQMRMRKPE